MTPQEHAAQVSAARASLLLDSARPTRHDVYPAVAPVAAQQWRTT